MNVQYINEVPILSEIHRIKVIFTLFSVFIRIGGSFDMIVNVRVLLVSRKDTNQLEVTVPQ